MLCCVVCVVVVVVFLVVVVCVCVCGGTLKKRGKTRVWIQKRLRVSIQNVPFCAHGDVWNVHNEEQGVIASSVHQNLPTYGYQVL